MKFFRYRRPSLKTLLGVTKANKRIKRDLGMVGGMILLGLGVAWVVV